MSQVRPSSAHKDWPRRRAREPVLSPGQGAGAALGCFRNSSCSFSPEKNHRLPAGGAAGEKEGGNRPAARDTHRPLHPPLPPGRPSWASSCGKRRTLNPLLPPPAPPPPAGPLSLHSGTLLSPQPRVPTISSTPDRPPLRSRPTRAPAPPPSRPSSLPLTRQGPVPPEGPLRAYQAP